MQVKFYMTDRWRNLVTYVTEPIERLKFDSGTNNSSYKVLMHSLAIWDNRLELELENNAA